MDLIQKLQNKVVPFAENQFLINLENLNGHKQHKKITVLPKNKTFKCVALQDLADRFSILFCFK